ncbi:hypothetical protein POTOM_024401 [Populus tomentosa]|uniref:Uncharacterized protein n=1 Tax=Populus tomentosa TaxID=118781 RepID=A0A8X8CRF4_POPTO|nr:hypothetical protein POTOM_024401 [Populus tomentosa]
MFSSSQFDATSAFSGGGFMPSQSTQLTDSTPSPAKASLLSLSLSLRVFCFVNFAPINNCFPFFHSSRKSLGVVPVTVKQTSQASQSGDEKSSFVINGVDVTNVTVVGMVFNKAEKSTDVSFVIDDGTGRVGCRRWVTENFDKLEMEAVQDEMYVRVIGHLRVFLDVKQLVAFSVRLHTFAFAEFQIAAIDLGADELCSINKGGASTQPHMVESSTNTPVRNGQTFTSNLMSKQFDVDGLKDCDQLVLDRLQQSSSIGQEKGMHMDELCQQLKLPMEKIK